MAVIQDTLETGVPTDCEVCGTHMRLEVLPSNSGFYIGTRCHCGPYRRESRYFPSREGAALALHAGTYSRD